MSNYTPPPRALTPSSMICFRAGDLLPALQVRAAPSETGAVCRRDLRRFYWLLAVALESAPPVTEATLAEVVVRARAALSEDSSAGDLTAPLVACIDLLPGWSALQLFALADRLETLARRAEGGEGLLLADHTQIGLRLVRDGQGGVSDGQGGVGNGQVRVRRPRGKSR